MNKQIEEAENIFLKAYNRYPVVFERGEGCRLYDKEGREYMDFFAGIGVHALGHHYPGLDEALKEQIDRLWHISNYFYNEPAISAGEKLLKISSMDRIFFTNSGTEAVEGAIKLARKYSYNKYGNKRNEIIAMKKSFHGRSLGALSVTGNEAYRTPFEPLLSKTVFAEYNNIESVRQSISDKTYAIIAEPIQGEGGIYPGSREFLEGLGKLAYEYDLILIFDEIQCGMGRSGNYFAWQKYGVKPDILCAAKAIGNGMPVGAFMAGERAAAAMSAGDHGSTYGGNPLVCTAVSKVLDIFEEDKIIEKVNASGAYLKKRLNELVSKYGHIKECRGEGLLLGLEFDCNIGELLKYLILEEHIVLINAGSRVLRFIPPLIITTEDIDEAIKRIERGLKCML